MGYIIRNGVIYGGGSGGGDSIFHGTQAEWNALTTAEKAEYDFAAFTDDYDPTNISNPNLLDNPWFTVNQRRASQISNGYSVDRWVTGRLSGSIDTDGIKSVVFDGTSGYNSGYLSQRIEKTFSSKLYGKTVTLSAIIDDNLCTVTGVMPTAEDTSLGMYFFNNEIWLGITHSTNANIDWMNVNFLSTSNAHSVKAVKLELGSQSTLAMDAAPNYQQELAKCQRYFFRMYGSNTSLMAGMCVNGGNGANRFCFSLPVPMRTLAPSVTYSNLSDFKVSGSDGAGGVVPTTLTRVGNMTGVMYGVEMKATGFTTGQVVIFYSINTTGYIDFTADL